MSTMIARGMTNWIHMTRPCWPEERRRRYAATHQAFILAGGLAMSFINVTDLAAQAGASTQLFNGRDLTGWEHVGPGEVVVDSGLMRTRAGMGLLWYAPRKIGNAVIRVVY